MPSPAGLPQSETPPSDEALVREVLAGETRLFEVLMRRNNQRLYRALRSVVADEAAVEEAMQQTYVLAFQRLGQFQGTSSFSTWLTRIGLNEGLQQLRHARMRARIEGDLEMDEEMIAMPRPENPEKQAGAREVVRMLEELVDALPEHHRVALVLAEVEQLSMQEAADAMGVTEETARQRVSRARRLLRERIEQRTGEQLREVFPFEARRCDRVVAAVYAALAG